MSSINSRKVIPVSFEVLEKNNQVLETVFHLLKYNLVLPEKRLEKFEELLSLIEIKGTKDLAEKIESVNLRYTQMLKRFEKEKEYQFSIIPLTQIEFNLDHLIYEGVFNSILKYNNKIEDKKSITVSSFFKSCTNSFTVRQIKMNDYISNYKITVLSSYFSYLMGSNYSIEESSSCKYLFGQAADITRKFYQKANS